MPLGKSFNSIVETTYNTPLVRINRVIPSGGATGRRGGRGGPNDEGAYDAEAVQRTSRSQAGSYNPFATFFQSRRDETAE